MANGEICKHCGYQEADHDVGRAVKENGRRCYRFVSTRKHKRGCPRVGCEGNCDAMIAEEKWRAEHPTPVRGR